MIFFMNLMMVNNILAGRQLQYDDSSNPNIVENNGILQIIASTQIVLNKLILKIGELEDYRMRYAKKLENMEERIRFNGEQKANYESNLNTRDNDRILTTGSQDSIVLEELKKNFLIYSIDFDKSKKDVDELRISLRGLSNLENINIVDFKMLLIKTEVLQKNIDMFMELAKEEFESKNWYGE